MLRALAALQRADSAGSLKALLALLAQPVRASRRLVKVGFCPRSANTRNPPQALNIAGQTKAMTQGQPTQAPQAQFQQGPGFAGLLTPTVQVDPEKRRQAQQMAVQGLLGGYRG